MNKLSRRNFINQATLGSGLLILPSGSFAGPNSPNNKLNIALIGVGGQGRWLRQFFKDENIVAVCDVDELALGSAASAFPKAARYNDWRRCLDDKNVQAVVVASNDRSHALIGVWAMNRGMHVYLEKPIAVSVEECRLLRKTYNANRGKISTQLGTQRSGHVNLRRVKDLIRDGAVGTLQSVQAWTTSESVCDGYLPAAGNPPSTLHYDLWLGPAPYHPYNPDYFGSCGKWQKYWDFGTGQLGNWGSHIADIAWMAMEGGLPLNASGEGDAYHPEAVPSKLKLNFDLPENDWRPPIRFQWNQGGYLPDSPKPEVIDLAKIKFGGAVFKGTKGSLVADFLSRMLIPVGDEADLSYFKRRNPDERTPAVPKWRKEWIDACKGGPEPSCNFDYSAPIMETLLVGLAAWRANAKVNYDGKLGRITNNNDANLYLKRSYREGWPLNG